MNAVRVSMLAILLVGVGTAVTAAAPAPVPLAGGSAHASAVFWNRPIGFEANRGQAAGTVQFFSRGRGYTLTLTEDGMVFAAEAGRRSASDPSHHSGGAIQDRRVGTMLSFCGANRAAAVEGLEEQPGRVNYLLGRDFRRWRRNIPVFAKVRYRGVYPGIDLVYYGSGQRVEHDFLVSPDANPSDIRMRFRGASGLHLDTHGNLVLATPGGTIFERAPIIYQERGGRRIPVAGGYRMGPPVVGNRGRGPGRAMAEIGFWIGHYDHHRPLILDPVITYSTYLGGSDTDRGEGIAVDPATGDAYVTGSTQSGDFPITVGAFPGPTSSASNANAFVTKLGPDGTILYSTYFGGSGDDTPYGIAVDTSGSVTVTGQTSSTDMPLVNPLPITPGAGHPHAFIFRLDRTGARVVYSSYLGGSGEDKGSAAAVDAAGNVYAAGYTTSSDFPRVNPLPVNLSEGNPHGFVVEIDPTQQGGAALVYSTFVGGDGRDHVNDIAVRASGAGSEIYITGDTTSTDFPRVNPLPVLGEDGFPHAFVSKIDPSKTGGAALVYSTYLAGNNSDVGTGIAVDLSGGVYVTGSTASSNFPVTGQSIQPSLAGGTDAFVVKLDPAQQGGAALIYSTYFGGSAEDDGARIVVDPSGNAYLAGSTASANFPTASPLPLTVNLDTNHFHGYVAKLNSSGTQVLYSTYLGGNNQEHVTDIGVDLMGNAYVTGDTTSTDFPTMNAGQSQLSGMSDAFVARMAASATAPPTAPTNLAAAATSSSQITLTWTPGGSDATGIKIERRTGTGSYAQITAAAFNATTYADSGLMAGTAYTYRIRATNSGGDSPYSNEASATTLTNPAGAPMNLAAAPVSQTMIRVTWEDADTSLVSFSLERKAAGADFTPIAALPADARSYDDSGLTAQTAYTYRIRASSASGDSPYSNEATATTLPNPPAAPGSLTAAADSSTEVKLTWADNSANETGFEVERKGADGGYAKIATTLANVTAYTDTGLTAGATYTYRVRAVNAGGASGYSNEAIVTLPGSAVAAADSISGTVALVFNGRTTPVPGLMAQLTDSGGKTSSATTDAAGHYSFPGLADGGYTVQVLAAGYLPAAPRQVTVGPDARTAAVDFALSPLSSFPAGLSLVSIPYDYSATPMDAAALFGLTAAADGSAKIAAWAPVGMAYAIYPHLPGTIIQVGRGYWIKEDAAQPFTHPGQIAASPFAETLAPGWNLIGDPFTAPIDWGTAEFTSSGPVGVNAPGTSLTLQAAAVAQLIPGPLWLYDTSVQQYRATSSLQPYQGDWIYVNPQIAGGATVTLRLTRP